jgi:nitrate/nitrite transporter NarK
MRNIPLDRVAYVNRLLAAAGCLIGFVQERIVLIFVLGTKPVVGVCVCVLVCVCVCVCERERARERESERERERVRITLELEKPDMKPSP